MPPAYFPAARAMGQPQVQPQAQPQQQQQAASQDDSLVRLQKAKQPLDAGLITQEEFDKKKQDMLNSI